MTAIESIEKLIVHWMLSADKFKPGQLENWIEAAGVILEELE